MSQSAAVLERVRVDIWLDVACLFRTRSEAQKACQLGRVEVNGARAKAHREVKAGDEVLIERPAGRKQKLVVRSVADHHIAKAEARQLYDDVTPPPTPEELEWRRMAALAGPRPIQKGRAPSRRDRQALRNVKESGF